MCEGQAVLPGPRGSRTLSPRHPFSLWRMGQRPQLWLLSFPWRCPEIPSLWAPGKQSAGGGGMPGGAEECEVREAVFRRRLERGVTSSRHAGDSRKEPLGRSVRAAQPPERHPPAPHQNPRLGDQV